MNNQDAPLNKEEQEEYDRLMELYKSAGGDANNPLDETTIRLFRGEAAKQPERSISPEQIDRLRQLYRKRINQTLKTD